MAKVKLASISKKAPRNIDKEKTNAKTEKILIELDELQNILISEAKNALLVVIQV